MMRHRDGVPTTVVSGIRVTTVEQTIIDGDESGRARLVIGTHKAREQDLSETVDRLAASDVVERVVSVLRVEGS